MKVYFSPLACSMASLFALHEAGADAEFIEVDPKTKRTMAGDDFYDLNPIGLVPAIRTNDGEVLTENAAVLQYIADRFPEAALAPLAGMERLKLHQWLCFIGTELHKALFVPLFDKTASDAAILSTLEKGASRLAYLNRYLNGREFLLERFSVADAYLVTVLNWKIATPVDLSKWPAIASYFDRMKIRPSVAKALAEEFALYAAEQKRHQAA